MEGNKVSEPGQCRRVGTDQLRAAARLLMTRELTSVLRPQLFEEPNQSQTFACRIAGVRRKHPVKLSFPTTQLGTRLNLPLIRKRCLTRAKNLAHRVARYLQGAGDLLDRLPFDQMFAPYPADRLHNQHPPPPASNQSRQPSRPVSRGSILDADPPPQGVKVARRDALTLARCRSGWQCPRHSCPEPAQRESPHTFLQETFEGLALCATRHDHR